MFLNQKIEKLKIKKNFKYQIKKIKKFLNK